MRIPIEPNKPSMGRGQRYLLIFGLLREFSFLSWSTDANGSVPIAPEQWHQAQVPAGVGAVMSFAAGPDGYLAVTRAGKVLWSADAVAWISRITLETNLWSITYGDAGFVIKGLGLWRSDTGL